jgi:3-methyl-2-oxobutanoate hydroxymethyltransferase
MPKTAGKLITDNSKVPIYGIGAGESTDGQLLIMHDLMGLKN